MLLLNRRLRSWLAWLALFACIGNVLLPAALVLGVERVEAEGQTFRLVLCGRAAHGDIPGKAGPAPRDDHCAPCMMVPNALPPDRRVNLVPPLMAGDAAFPSPPADVPSVFFRNYRGQPRAPPVPA